MLWVPSHGTVVRNSGNSGAPCGAHESRDVSGLHRRVVGAEEPDLRQVPKERVRQRGCTRQLPTLNDAPSQLSLESWAGLENGEGSAKVLGTIPAT